MHIRGRLPLKWHSYALRLPLDWPQPSAACGRSHILSALNRERSMPCDTVWADWTRRRANKGRFVCANSLIWLFTGKWAKPFLTFVQLVQPTKKTFTVSSPKNALDIEKTDNYQNSLSDNVKLRRFFWHFTSAHCHRAVSRPRPCSSNVSQRIATTSHFFVSSPTVSIQCVSLVDSSLHIIHSFPLLLLISFLHL